MRKPWIALPFLWIGFTAFAASGTSSVDFELKNAQGEKIGKARVTSIEGGVNLELEAEKLSPGKHGIHFHEVGKCEGPDFKSAGGHLNPGKKAHGLENPKGSHAGDMPNIEVREDGTVKAKITSHGAALDQGSLLKPGGTALVIHAKADDQKSDPAGNAGDRVACGVIAQDSKAKGKVTSEAPR